MVEIGHI